MFRFWIRRVNKRSSTVMSRTKRTTVRLQVDRLEDRCVPTVSITSVQGPAVNSSTVPVAMEGMAAIPALSAAFTDTNTSLIAAQYVVVVNYGDGTTPSTNAVPAPTGTTFDSTLVVSGSAGNFTIADNHTFPEESGSTIPGAAGTEFPITVTVTENITAGASGTGTGSAQVLDAPLSPGTPITVPVTGTQTFFGGNTGGKATAAEALASFEAAIGGVKNTATAPQTGGFRTITWDGVKTDGTDAAAGPNSTVVITPQTVGIPLDRFQGQGVFFGAVYAVSSDGFVGVNANVGSPLLFPAFSAPKTFAMFNDNGIDFKFVAASPTNSALVSAASKGFGSIFLNVQQPGTTITYFHGSTVLDTLAVPVNATPGAAVFAGELFPSALVTNVLLTLGTGVIFKFDGTTVTSGGANTAADNLVAVDDWAFAEPVPIANGFPITSGPAGTTNAASNIAAGANTSFTGVVATFSDADPGGNAKDFTATINWGDGHLTNGSISANSSGGFNVTGTNTYAQTGAFPVNVDIADFGGGPGVGGSQPILSVNNTATVSAAPFTLPGTSGNDTLVISRPVGGVAGDVTFVLNGAAPVTLHGVSAFTFAAGSGNDTVTVDYVNGTPLISGGIFDMEGNGNSGLVVDASKTTATNIVTLTNAQVTTTIGADSLAIHYTTSGGTFGGGVVLKTGSAGDSVNVQSTLAGAPTTVNTGAGDDAIVISSDAGANGTLSGIQGAVTVDAGAGNNLLEVGERSATAADQVFVTNSAITSGFGTFAPITYTATGGSFASGIVLRTGMGNDIVNVQSTLAGATTFLGTYEGDDVVLVSSNSTATGVLTGIAGLLSIDAGTGNNSLYASEQSLTVADTVDLSQTSISSETRAFASIYYQASGGTFGSGVVFRAGQANDVVNVFSKLAGSLVVIGAGAGNDIIDVDVFSNSGYSGVFVDGGGGTDILDVFDVTGGATAQNVSSGTGAGTLEVFYAGGLTSFINYSNVLFAGVFSGGKQIA